MPAKKNDSPIETHVENAEGHFTRHPQGKSKWLAVSKFSNKYDLFQVVFVFGQPTPHKGCSHAIRGENHYDVEMGMNNRIFEYSNFESCSNIIRIKYAHISNNQIIYST